MMTMSEIRAADIAAGGHFFDRVTMRHYGQTMRHFRLLAAKCQQCPDGILFSGTSAGVVTVYRFNPSTGRIVTHERAIP